MEAFASFVFSEQGVLYGRICQQWGVDPGAVFTDDFIAHNVRAGLLVSMAKQKDEPVTESAEPNISGKIVTDLEQQIEAMR